MKAVEIKLDLTTLEALAEKLKKYRLRDGRWRPIPPRRAKEAWETYKTFWEDLASKHLHYDPKKHILNITKIYVSEDVDDLICKILPPLDYLDFSPAVDATLPPKTCRLTEEALLDRSLLETEKKR